MARKIGKAYYCVTCGRRYKTLKEAAFCENNHEMDKIMKTEGIVMTKEERRESTLKYLANSIEDEKRYLENLQNTLNDIPEGNDVYKIVLQYKIMCMEHQIEQDQFLLDNQDIVDEFY